MTKLRLRYIEDLRLRNYSTKTQKIYCDCVSHFARFFKQSPEELGPEHIREYQLYLINEKKSSWSYFNQTICALRFLYRETLGRDWVVNHLPFPRKQKKLPVVLSKDEVSQLLGAVGDPKYKAVLSMIYATGRRVSEAAHLQVAGLDSHRMLIRVREAKGNKDRYVVLSPALLEMLREYWKKYRPTQWLFSGATPDKPVGTDSIQKACASARRVAAFQKKATPHTLRHSFATHLLENGSNIRVIQTLLGHTILRTTAQYTHVSPQSIAATVSPYDTLSRA